MSEVPIGAEEPDELTRVPVAAVCGNPEEPAAAITAGND